MNTSLTSIWHSSTARKLGHVGATSNDTVTGKARHRKYVKILKYLYKNPTAKKNHLEDGISISNDITIRRGVRQGDPISPKLFIATLEEIFRNITWEEKGIHIDGEYFTHLRFADDILIVSQSTKSRECCSTYIKKAPKQA